MTALLGVLFLIPTSGGAPSAAAGPLDGFASANVQFVKNLTLDYTNHGRVVGTHYYATSPRGLAIFDVSRPLEPKLLSRLPLNGDPLGNEDVDTNGKILLFEEDFSASDGLAVVDVRDPSEPFVLAKIPGISDHTFTCLFDCNWAYGSQRGLIIDLRDPAEPRVVPGRWNFGLRFNPGPGPSPVAHDVTEVAPGLVLTASNPMYLLNTRDPRSPKVLAVSDGSPYGFGGVQWANGGRDGIVVSFQTPIRAAAPNCRIRDLLRGTSLDTGLKTWDAAHWQKRQIFTGIDVYSASDGTFTDGNPPVGGAAAEAGGCSATYFDLHPRFHNGGIIALAHMSNGLKFLRIDRSGKIREVGFWLAARPFNSVGDADWVSEDVVYTTNGQYGIDILRFKGGIP